MPQSSAFVGNSDEDLNGEENDTYIRKAAEDATAVIIAWGKAINTNARIEERAVQVINLLEPYREKLYVISDGERLGLHPLTPAIRQVWQLIPFDATKQQKATTDFVEITDEDFNEDKEATTTALDF